MHVRYYYVKRLVQVLTAKEYIINVSGKKGRLLNKVTSVGVQKTIPHNKVLWHSEYFELKKTGRP